MVTGQRKGEIISAEWDEFDLNSGWWTIPASKSKNGNNHLVPLSDLALEILRELKALSDESKWLFPSPVGSTRIIPTTVNHAARKNIGKFKDIKPFTPHDLRAYRS